jgi:hypothetical protein
VNNRNLVEIQKKVDQFIKSKYNDYSKKKFTIFGKLSWSADSRFLLVNYRELVILYHIASKVGILLDFLKKTKYTLFHPSIPNWILYVTRPIDTSDTIVVYDLGTLILS